MFTGEYLTIFDPAGRLYPPGQGGGAARQYKLDASEIAEAYPHQFAGWSFASKGPFTSAIAKTLIRVPLRTADQASRSQLSQVCHLNHDDVLHNSPLRVDKQNSPTTGKSLSRDLTLKLQ